MSTTNNRKVYSFKSVGELEVDLNQNAKQVRQKNPIGIATPVQLGSNSLLKMNTDRLNVIKDNFRNMTISMKKA